MILRKGFIIFFSLLLLNSQYILCQMNLSDIASMQKVSILNEPFNDNSNNWITNNNYLTGRFENGSFIIKCKNFQGFSGLTYKEIKLDLSKDFEIESTLKIEKGAGGLLLGMNTNYDHYRIDITDKNDIIIEKNSTSKKKLEVLYTVSKSPLIKAGSSVKINICKVNGIFYVFINESLVKDLYNIKPEGNMIGFNVGLNSQLAVDYLNISYLEKKSSPLLAERNMISKDSVLNVAQSQKPVAPLQIALANPNGSGVPVITWKAPVAVRTSLSNYSAWAKAVVKSTLKLEKVFVYVNGISVGECEFKPVAGEPGNYSIEKLITFKPGENSVYFVATDEKQQSEKSDLRYFTNPEATLPVLSWGKPNEATTVSNSENITIEAFIKSPSGLNSAKVLVIWCGSIRGKYTTESCT
jgi:hypothetical protein